MSLWTYLKNKVDMMLGMPEHLNQISQSIQVLLEKENAMTAELDTLQKTVADVVTAVDAAVDHIQALSDTINAGYTDPAALQAISDQLAAVVSKINAAVASTPLPAPLPTQPAAKQKKE